MKKRTKRYDGEDGSLVESGSGPSMEDDNSGAPPVAASEPRAAAPKQRIVSKAELEKSGLSLRDFLNKERGLTRRGGGSPAPTAPAPVKTERPTTPPVGNAEDATAAPKKQMYRTFGGKMAEKAPESDVMSGVREKVGSGLKSAAEGIGNYARGLAKREDKHGTYVKDGKVVKYAKGGSVSKASSRADGIAQRGKTKGRMV
jgi:hypothetical protein